MSESHFPLEVITTYSSKIVRIPHWKSFDLLIGFTEDVNGLLMVHIGDGKRILNFSQGPYYLTETTVDKITELAKDLEDYWSRFSRLRPSQLDFPENELARPQHLAAIGRQIFDLLFPVDPADPAALSSLVAEAIRYAQARWIEAYRQGPPKPEPTNAANALNVSAKKVAEKQWPAPAFEIGFYSDRLHIPWNLLYVFEGFSAGEDGFLGRAMSLEDVSNFQTNKVFDKQDWGTVSPVRVSLQLDDKVSAGVHEAVADVLSQYGPQRVEVSIRSRSQEFFEAFGRKQAIEEIMYFCCHTNPKGPQLRLSDPEPIYSDKIRVLAKGADLKQWPMVFLNTCWGAVATHRLRTSFVEAFMTGGAVAVVGVEAEVEENFAADYAREFLRLVLDSEDAKESLGDLAFRARLKLWTQPSGIAGLLYSVYSRTPVRFRLPRKIASAVNADTRPEAVHER